MISLRYDDVIWSIPVIFGDDLLCFSFLNILDKKNIDYNFELYGAPVCKWNDEKYNFIETNDINFVERIIDNFKFRNTYPVLSLDKFDISGKDLKDDFSNDILKKCEEFDCNVTVASPKLLKYIRKNFPKIKCIASQLNTIKRFEKDILNKSYKPEKELKYYNDLLKLYDRIILRPDFVKTPYIKDIKDLSKVEVIVNYDCIQNCSHSSDFQTNDNCNLKCVKDYTYFDELNPDLFLSFEEIEKLKNLGIKHFRILPDITGNNNILLMNIINYVFKADVLNAQLFNLTIKNLDEVKYFYSEEIIKNSLIHNLFYKRKNII